MTNCNARARGSGRRLDRGRTWLALRPARLPSSNRWLGSIRPCLDDCKVEMVGSNGRDAPEHSLIASTHSHGGSMQLTQNNVSDTGRRVQTFLDSQSAVLG